MTAVRKKKQAASSPLRQSVSEASEPKEPVVVSDTVTETTERIEVIEEVTPKAESETPAESAPAEDPLTEFKEKMTKEEKTPVSSLSPSRNFMWPILSIFIIALLTLGGIFVYKSTKGEKIKVAAPSPTPTVMPQPTKAVDLTEYPIKILNGSGVSGEAGRQKESLEGEGLSVSSIGNADNSDYADTIIQAKENVDKAFLDKLKSILEESFTVGEIEELPEDADSNVIVILGEGR